jgi:hypothetical protein
MPPRRRAGGGGDAAGSGAAGESAADDARPIFLTVGTTSFDALVAAADTPAFLATCAAKGYTSLTIQARAHARQNADNAPHDSRDTACRVAQT